MRLSINKNNKRIENDLKPVEDTEYEICLIFKNILKFPFGSNAKSPKHN